MSRYDVIIIGGGVAGITCALTLASTEDKFPWTQGKKYLVIDDNDSDLCKAKLFNVPGVEFGANGGETIEKMKEQLRNFKSVEFLNDTAVVAEEEAQVFKIETKSGDIYEAENLVIATGMHGFDIEKLGVEIVPHDKTMKPGKIKIKNKDLKVRQGLYVAGLAAGSKTMFAIAAGNGAQVACDIFEEWSGKFAVAHDSARKN